MASDWRQPKVWAGILLILVAVLVIVTIAPWLMPQGLDCSSGTACLRTIRGVVVLGAVAVLAALLFFFFAGAWQWRMPPETTTGTAAQTFYPQGATRPVAWIVFFWLVVALAGLFMVFADPWQLAQRKPDHLHEMLLAVFSAGAGSSVATIMAYLRHASSKGDFQYAYVPWYLMRPLLGGLLGLIFYFLMRGGIIALLETPPTSDSLDDLALAGVSSLVGLFSNEAFMKLQEVFSTLFHVKPGRDADS